MKSIKTRIILWTGGALLSVAFALMFFSFQSSKEVQSLVKERTREILLTEVKKEVVAQSNYGAGVIVNNLSTSLDYTKALASSFSVIQRTAKNEALNDGSIRVTMNDILKDSLNGNSQFLAVYTAWEADKLDFMDSTYSNRDASYDQTGRFIPYWSLANNQASTSALVDYENQTRGSNGFRAGEYYLCSKDSKQACIIDPYSYPINGKDVLLTSLVSPILINNQFAGIVGVDISLDFLQQLAQEISQSLYNGQSEVIILGNSGIVAGHSQGKGQGENFSRLYPSGWEKELSAIKSGLTTVSDDHSKGFVRASIPIQIGSTNTPWSMLVSIPRSAVLASINEMDTSISSIVNSSINFQVILGIMITALALAAIWAASAGIVQPIRNTVELLTHVAQGNLTQRLKTNKRDETGILIGTCNTLAEKMQSMIRDIQDSGHKLSASAESSSAISYQTRQGVDKQQDEIALISTAVSEMTSTAQAVATSAQQANEATLTVHQEANQSQNVIRLTTDSINELATEVQEASNVIQQLAEDSQNIYSILDVIRAITEQTNLLALNAAIEAARAGEAGRGFAVVADEVRNLAQRTQSSTDEVQGMIENLQQGTQRAVEVMNRSQEKANTSIDRAAQANNSLVSILESVTLLGDLNAQVASAAEQQSGVAEDINVNLISINKVAEETVIGAEQSTTSSEQLTHLSQRLNHIVKQFVI